MSRSCTLYENTGLQAGEIIDSPAKLASISAVITKSPLEIITNAWLDSIVISSSNIEAEVVDFIRIGKETGELYDWYYKVRSFEPVTDSTFRFYLDPVGILIAGGVDQLESIEGIARRYNVTNDTYGAYCLDDPYTAPAEPLQIVEGTPETGTQSEVQFVASSIELLTQGVVDHIHLNTYNKTLSNIVTESYNKEMGEGVDYYKTFATPYHTTFYGPDSSLTEGNAYNLGGICLYVLRQSENDIDSQGVKRGIEAARSIGAESGIIASYKIPSKYIGTWETQRIYMQQDNAYTSTARGMLNGILNLVPDMDIDNNLPNGGFYHIETFEASGEDPEPDIIIPGAVLSVDPDKVGILNTTTMYVKNIHGKTDQCGYKAPAFKYTVSGYTPINNRVFYGSYQPYVLASIAGNQRQYNPEQVYWSETDYPLIDFISDVSPDGTVYYYFPYLYQKSVSKGTMLGNLIPSLQWTSVPLTYTDVSGGKLNQQQFVQGQSSLNLSYSQQTRGFLNQSLLGIGDALGGSVSGADNDVSPLLSLISGVAGVGAKVAGGVAGAASSVGIAGAASGVGGAIAGGGLATASAAALPLVAVGAGAMALGASKYSKLNKVRESYILDTKNSLASYLSTNNVSVPTISFPPNMTIARQTYGEQPICYRYRYSDNDVKRIDKILTMYGYRTCDPADISMLTSHQAFNYFEGDVKVKGKNQVMPSWLTELCSAELSAGVRIWHQLSLIHI